MAACCDARQGSRNRAPDDRYVPRSSVLTHLWREIPTSPTHRIGTFTSIPSLDLSQFKQSLTDSSWLQNRPRTEPLLPSVALTVKSMQSLEREVTPYVCRAADPLFSSFCCCFQFCSSLRRSRPPPTWC